MEEIFIVVSQEGAVGEVFVLGRVFNLIGA